jgi:segregation and condensation protein B
MEITQIIPHVEALIFASDHPLPEMEIVDLLNHSQGFLEDIATLEQVQSAIEAIREKYSSEFYSFEIRPSGGGYQFLTKPAFYPTVAQLNGDKYLKKLSVAAMETLAIIAYKQPVTKGDIEAIRGVNSDYSIQKLLEKELIVITGRKEELPGKPLVYCTSKSFMDYFGINKPQDLPQIKEVLQEELPHTILIQGTNQESNGFPPQNETDPTEDEASGYYSVSETGELMIKEDSDDLPDHGNSEGNDQGSANEYPPDDKKDED